LQVNDLLEYSRLNHDTQKRRKLQLHGPPGNTPENEATLPDRSTTTAEIESGFNISTLTEDAVTAACLGFDQRSLQSQDLQDAESDHSAVLVLDIDEALSSDWTFSVASGSWKRICINLVANALKYTPSGYVDVALRKTMLKRKHGKSRTALVELVVSWSLVWMGRSGGWVTMWRVVCNVVNLLLIKFTRSKIPVLGCPKNSKLRISSGHSGRRITSHRALDL